MTDINHRITARALANRGFVVIHGHGATWTATITDAGIAALQEAAQPQEESRAAEFEAEVLLRAVIDARGALPAMGKRDHTSDIRLIAAALRVSWRPKGKKLELYSHWGENTEWRIVDHYPDMVDPAPVPIPTTLRNPRPAVVAYGNNKRWQQVCKPHVHRASLILQAVAAEAEHRGYVARTPKPERSEYGRSNNESRADMHLVIDINGATFPLTIKEISEPGGAPLDYYSRDRLPGWMGRRQTAFISTGRLQLSLDSRYNGRKHEFRDSKRSTLENALPEVLREMEIRNLEDLAKQRERDDAAAKAQVRWENAMRRAEDNLQYEHKAKRLRSQVSAWQETEAIHGYIQAMTEATALLPTEERADATAWIEWARQYAEQLDPLGKRLAVPEDRRFTSDDLKPFLGGLSPYGP
jgi:hypothetical protein